jgi:hypothetical protein
MVVGPSGKNADRVTAALELARVKVVRVGSAPVACEKLAGAMPQVVILVARPADAMRADLAERAEAVGAIVVEVDASLEGDAYEDVVNEIITTAITRKMERDEVSPSSEGATLEPPPEYRTNGNMSEAPVMLTEHDVDLDDVARRDSKGPPALEPEKTNGVDDGWDD